MKSRKRLKNSGIKIILITLLPLIIYGIMAIILGLIPINRVFKQQKNGTVELFLVGNNIHAGLALPVEHPYRDWRTHFPTNDTTNPERAQIQPYVLIGWGSESFYTKVPKWRDIRPSTAFKALFFDRSLLHVVYIDKPNRLDYQSIWLTKKQYQKLIDHIDRDSSLPSRSIGYHYYETDAFYSANGYYSPLNTCNDWVRKQLKSAGVTVPFWSPFSYPLFWHLR